MPSSQRADRTGPPPSTKTGSPAPPVAVENGRAAPTPAAGGIGLVAAGIGLAVLVALVAVLAETYEAVKERDDLSLVDQPLLDWSVAHRTPVLDSVVTAFTNIGGPVILPILATLVTLLLARAWRSWTPIVLMVAATAGSLAMTHTGKDLAARVRPPHALAVPPYENSPSFPSGHALNSTVIVLVLAYLIQLHVSSRRARTVSFVGLGLYACAIGLSRVYLGHHWFTDVVAGWLAGAAWALVLILAHRLVLLMQRRRHAEESTIRADDSPISDRTNTLPENLDTTGS